MYLITLPVRLGPTRFLGLAKGFFLLYSLCFPSFFSAQIAESVFIDVSSVSAHTGDTVRIAVRVSQFYNIDGYTMRLKWDPAHLQYSKAGYVHALDINAERALDQGEIFMIWLDFSSGSTTLPDNSLLFEAFFIVKATASGVYPVFFQKTNTTPIEVTRAGKVLSIIQQTGGVSIDQPTPGDLKFLHPVMQISPCVFITQARLDMRVTGGVPPYIYEWTGPDAYTSDQAEVSDLLNGNTYLLTVTDAAGSKINTIIVPVGPKSPNDVLSYQVKEAQCRQDNGSIRIRTGQPDLSYQWSDNGPPLPERTNLAPGDYTVTVTHKSGCSMIHTLTVRYLYNTLGVIFNRRSSDCSENKGGHLGITPVYGHTPPLTYQWSNGATTQYIENAPAGIYYVTLSDAANCVDVFQDTIFDVTLSTWFHYFQTQPRIDTARSKIVYDLEIGGGPKVDMIRWNTGNVTEQGVSDTKIDILSNPPDGRYEVTLSDKNLCTQKIATVHNVDQSGVLITGKDNPFFKMEQNSRLADSCINVSYGSGGRLKTITFDLEWNPDVKFNKIVLKHPALTPANFKTGNSSLSLNWNAPDTAVQFRTGPLFSVCFLPVSPSMERSLISFSKRTVSSFRVIDKDDRFTGFLGLNDYVFFKKPSSTYRNFSHSAIVPPSCSAGSSYKMQTISNAVAYRHNGGPWKGENRPRVYDLQPGMYEIIELYMPWDFSSELIAYIPPPPTPLPSSAWPGDADANGAVNHHDFAAWGLALGIKGTPKSVQDTLAWQGYCVDDWSPALPYTDPKHADADGNGIVEASDTSLIRKFQGHIQIKYKNMRYDMPACQKDYSATIRRTDVSVPKVPCGRALSLPLYLYAEEPMPGAGVHGYSFSVTYPPTDSSVVFAPVQSSLGIPDKDLLIVQYNDRPNHRIDVVITRTDGKGIFIKDSLLLGSLNWLPTKCLPQNPVERVFFTDNAVVLKADGTRTRMPLQRISTNTGGTTSLQPSALSASSVRVWPNPAAETLWVHSPDAVLQRITLTGADGRTYAEWSNLNGYYAAFPLENLPSGLYAARIQAQKGWTVKKVTIINPVKQ